MRKFKITKGFIKTLIKVREVCGESDNCDNCPFAIDRYHNCCFAGIPWHWDDLEDLLKQESEDKV